MKNPQEPPLNQGVRMKHFIRTALIAAALALPISGCANVKNAYNALTTASVSPEAVILAASTFDAFEVTATNYLRLRRCNGANGPICRDPAVTPIVVGSVRAGRVARNNLKQFLRTHPGQLGPQGDYDALVTATGTLRAALITYQSATK